MSNKSSQRSAKYFKQNFQKKVATLFLCGLYPFQWKWNRIYSHWICPFRYGKGQTENNFKRSMGQWTYSILFFFMLRLTVIFLDVIFMYQDYIPNRMTNILQLGWCSGVGFHIRKMQQIATDKKRCFRLHQRKY
jgi:hypothetical protein